MNLSMGWILTSGEISLSPYLPVDVNNVASVARVIQSDKDLLILNHINIDFPNLSLSGEQMLPQGQIKRHGHLQSSQAGQKAPFPLIQRGERWRQAASSPSALWGSPRSKTTLKLHFFPPFSISLTARTPNVSKEQMEEFKAHLHCLGFTEEDVFYTSTEVQTPPRVYEPQNRFCFQLGWGSGGYVSLVPQHSFPAVHPHSSSSILPQPFLVVLG